MRHVPMFTGRTARSLMLSAGLLVGFTPVARTAAQEVAPAVEPASATPGDPTIVMNRAAELLAGEAPVRARAMLRDLLRGDMGLRLTKTQADRLFRLVRDAERAIQASDPVDVSLEEAQIAYMNDRLDEAERHARAVVQSAGATAEQSATAEAVSALVSQRRTRLAGEFAGRLLEAEAAFNAGRYQDAAALARGLAATGAGTDASAMARLVSLTGRLEKIESATGGRLGGEAVALGAVTDQPSASAWLLERRDDVVVNVAASEALQPADNAINASVRAEAQRLFTEAMAAFERRDLGEAQRKLAEVLEPLYRVHLSPEQADAARNRLADARVQLGGLPGVDQAPGDPADLLDQTTGALDILRQQITAEFNNQIERGGTALNEGDLTRARELAATARVTLSRGRPYFRASDYAALETQVETLFANVTRAEEVQRVREAEQNERRLAESQREAEKGRATEKDRQIAELFDRIYALQQQQDYTKALEEVDRLLFVDPTNVHGKLLKNILGDVLIFSRYEQAGADLHRAVARLGAENREAVRPPLSFIEYPEDWIEISRRRGEPSQFHESAVNRAVLANLESTRQPFDVENVPLGDVLEYIRLAGNLDMDIDWASLENIAVDRDSEVTLRLTSAPLSVALERVLEQVSDPGTPAGFAVRDGIVTVASDEVLRRDTVLEIYDIRDLILEVPDFDEAPEFDLNTIFSQGGQAGGGGGGQSPFQQNQAQRDPLDRDEIIDELVGIIERYVDPEFWGDTGTIEPYNQSLIVRTTPKNHREITSLLGRLRQIRNMQINVEARFLLVSEDYFEQIGFDLDVYFGASSQAFQNAQLLDPTIGLENFFNFGGPIAGNSLPAVDQGGTVTRLGVVNTITGDGTLGGAPITQPRFEPGTIADEFTPIGAPQNSLGITQALGAASDFASEVLSVAPALGVAGRFLDDIQVDFLVEATQADRRSVQLTAPRLTFTNGQRAYVAVGTQVSFVSGAQPVVAAGSVAFTPQIGVVSEGAVLDVRGVVSADRRYVTLTLEIALADVSFEGTVGQQTQTTVGGAAGGGGVGGAAGTAAITIFTPEVTGSQLATTVTVPDQGTLLLGGQRIVNEFETESGVPVLSKIPIINRFFSNRIETKEERTLMILVKPTILIQNEEEERNFPGLLDATGLN